MGLTVGAVFSVGKFIFNKCEKKNISGVLSEDLDQEFQEAIEKVSNEMQAIYPNVMGGSIEMILRTEEIFECLVRVALFNEDISIISDIETIDISTLPKGFIDNVVIELKKELEKKYNFRKVIKDTEFQQYVINSINNIAKTNQEALNELKFLKDNAEVKFDFQAFMKRYSIVAMSLLTEINYFGLGLSPDVQRATKKLNDIYVKPSFKVKKETEGVNAEQGKDLSALLKEGEAPTVEEFGKLLNPEIIGDFKELFEFTDKHLVILGNPGAGKSLFGKYLISNILNGNSEEINIDIIDRVPFRIELRKYLPYKKENRGNLVTYLTNMLCQEYYVENLKEEQLKILLRNKKSIIIYDGLDEIFNTQDKISVKNDIEIFLSLFPAIRGIVSSRYIGYDEAKFNNQNFVEVEIMDFDDERIVGYVNKWYECETGHNNRVEQEIQGFLKLKDEIDRELITNPLLLSLIVILYRNNGKVPNSKLEIYRSCTKTLVDKWDETKKLTIEIKVKDKVGVIFPKLAFWQYEVMSQEELNKDNEINIVRKTVQNRIIDIILELKLTTHLSEAEKWAEEFLDYAQKRSLYFDSNFTHKTFLEYFTAFNIYQNSDKKLKPDYRNDIITKYIDNSFWYIVLELLVNLIDENQADSEVIDDLIQFHIDKKVESYVFFLHILHTLKNVSDEVVKLLLRKSLEYMVAMVDSNSKDLIYSISKRLELLPEKYKECIKKVYEDMLEGMENEGRESIVNYGKLGIYLERQSNVSVNKEIIKRFNKDEALFYLYNNKGEIINDNMIDEYIEVFGSNQFFADIEIPFEENLCLSSLGEMLFRELIETGEIKRFEKIAKLLLKKDIAKEDINHCLTMIKDAFNFRVSVIERILNSSSSNHEEERLDKLTEYMKDTLKEVETIEKLEDIVINL